jgi:hypothetical protein
LCPTASFGMTDLLTLVDSERLRAAQKSRGVDEIE